jgi:lipoic acid synthetase
MTFMILGNICTRSCLFCAVGKNKKLTLDLDEPKRISEAVKLLSLRYLVITSVTRDDLPDGGAGIFAKTIKLCRLVDKDIKIEILIPDFKADKNSLKTVMDARPSVLGHNLETVKRLHKELKPESGYQRSLEVLNEVKKINPLIPTKSSMLLGLGETESEVIEAMQDLRRVSCDMLTLGQYLAPSQNNCLTREYIRPAQFYKYKEIALSLGFKAVCSGPLVRSSFKAEDLYIRSQKPYN